MLYCNFLCIISSLGYWIQQQQKSYTWFNSKSPHHSLVLVNMWNKQLFIAQDAVVCTYFHHLAIQINKLINKKKGSAISSGKEKENMKIYEQRQKWMNFI